MNEQNENTDGLQNSGEPVPDMKELDPYRMNRGRSVPKLLKVIFIKFWFAGAVFYFVGWGIGIVTADQLDLVFVLGLVMGLVSDILLNGALRLMDRGGNEYDPYMLTPRRKWWTVFINIPYSMVLCTAVAYIYHFINLWAVIAQAKPEGTVVLGAEPLLYGLFYTALDMGVIGIKYLIARAVKKKETVEDA